MNTGITYVVGAGPYPYRSGGRRMTYTEAESYLIEEHGMGFTAANRALDMATTQAVRDAGTPEVEVLLGDWCREYRIAGADPVARVRAVRRLVREWRLTRAEAAAVLDNAPEPAA